MVEPAFSSSLFRLDMFFLDFYQKLRYLRKLTSAIFEPFAKILMLSSRINLSKACAKQHTPEFLKDEAIYKHNLTNVQRKLTQNRMYEPKPFDINEEW